MTLRLISIAAVSLALAGCANDYTSAQGQKSHLGAGSAQASPRTPTLAQAEQDADLRRAAKQTTSSKMLSAIALERVTGRKPDPSRFAELR